MANINQVITLGIGDPSGIKEFLTFGLQIGEAAEPLFSIHFIDTDSTRVILDSVLFSRVYLDTYPKLPSGD